MVAQYEAYQRAKINDNEPEIKYEIIEPRVSGLYDFCLKAVMDAFIESDWDRTLGYHFQEEDAAVWGAEKVYQYYSREIPFYRYLVCYEEHFVVVTFYWEAPTQEQMQIAGEKLRTAEEL